MTKCIPYPERDQLTREEFFRQLNYCWRCVTNSANHSYALISSLDEPSFSEVSLLFLEAHKQAEETSSPYNARSGWEALHWLSIFFDLLNAHLNLATDFESTEYAIAANHNRNLRITLRNLKGEIDFHAGDANIPAPAELKELQAQVEGWKKRAKVANREAAKFRHRAKELKNQQ